MALITRHLVVCRSSFCLKCWQKSRPQKHDKFLVYGSAHQRFKIKYAHQDGLKGFTPHLYTVQFPYKKNENGRIYITKICLMDGCGIEVGERRQNGDISFQFIDVSEHYLTELSVDALLKLWRGTGYELL